MKLISVDPVKCVRCRACAQVCPVGVIELSADGLPAPTNRAYELCINCGYCVDICVSGALGHRVRTRSANSDAAMRRYEVLQKRKNAAPNEK